MRRFICPASMQPHALEVLRGAYDIAGLQLPECSTVLDVGANVGAFAVWARKRWKDPTVQCYEPEDSNYQLLVQNTLDEDTGVHRCAVSDAGRPDEHGEIGLYRGMNNCGECSRHNLGEQSTERFTARLLRPTELPSCAFLKVDTEGCELEIIPAYLSSEAAGEGPLGVAYEWHRPEDRWELGHIMSMHKYRCVGDDVRRPDRGICKWIRKDVELS